MSSILIVDDEKSMRDFLTIMLTKEGYETKSAENGKAALEIIKEHIVDMVIADLKMPVMDGIRLLSEIKNLSKDIPVIMITAHGTTESAVEAMKSGAYDYITKPFKVDELKLIINNALENKRLKEENIYLKEELQEKYRFSNIIGKSEGIIKIFDLISKVADTNSNVLITGESGTGKELVAKAVHYNSSRKNKPFISVSCGALPEQLLESELFGHEKGAFTSADSSKAGLFEIANEGTFFLDEIGEAPLSIQVKLLRALQEREFKRVGGTRDIKVDLRIITATNQNLSELVEKGRFREDLFYRLNVIPIRLPTLRDRREDIPLLVDNFIRKFSDKKDGGNRKIEGISKDALSILESYDWPGNIRQLENVVERAVVLETTNIIQVDSLPDEIVSIVCMDIPEDVNVSGGVDLEKVIGNIERDLIEKALNQSGGIITKAAELLNLTQRSIRYKIKKHAISKGKK